MISLNTPRNKVSSFQACMKDEISGKTLFESLDRDGDGMVTLEDMKHAMKQFKLPEHYAKDFFNHARGGRWWEKGIS